METNKCSILDFLAENTVIKIPCWHRDFVWSEDKTNQLFEDIESLINTPELYSHFFGIIIHSAGDAFARVKLIDGEQRIIAVSIFLLAIFDCFNEQKLRKVLLLKGEKANKFVKIRLESNSNEIYNNLLNIEDFAYQNNSNYTQVYRDFVDKIEKSSYKLEEYIGALKKLQIIDIKLGAEDNPQLIFDSVNAFSTPLTRFEKIKNHIFMGIPENEQQKISLKYWEPIEKLFLHDANDFIKYLMCYVSMQQSNEKITKNNILKKFNKFYTYKRNYKSATEILSELFKFAQYYIRISNADFSKDIATELEKITQIYSEPELFSFMFELVDDFQNHLIPKKTFINILKSIYENLQLSILKKEKVDFSGLNTTISRLLAHTIAGKKYDK